MLCYYMCDPLIYKFQSLRIRLTENYTDTVQGRKHAEIGHYLAIVYVTQGPKMLKTDYFSLCILKKKRLPKVFYAFGSRTPQYENMWFVREILCDSSTAANQVNKKWAGTFCTRAFTGIIRKLLNILRLPREIPSVVAGIISQTNELWTAHGFQIKDFRKGFSPRY